MDMNDFNYAALLPKHNYGYEEKYVAYIDILGWKSKTSTNEVPNEVLAALHLLDEIHGYGSKEFQMKFEAQLPNEKNPFYQGIQCGIFSDGLLVSTPHINQIISIGNVVRSLLTLGFLTRGGITKGLCYHKENRAFGPAINRAVELEKSKEYGEYLNSKKEAGFHPPRIIIDKGIEREFHDCSYLGKCWIASDEYGKSVLQFQRNPSEEDQIRMVIGDKQSKKL